jgi:hypothetical protein
LRSVFYDACHRCDPGSSGVLRRREAYHKVQIGLCARERQVALGEARLYVSEC